ncbi:MAG: efflux RND transporter periplasmic adaptor subunit [Nitrospirae bacterium]|nr:efflux RND transporter periplasmic adaptor subunit [Nitrospirota bacterium]
MIKRNLSASQRVLNSGILIALLFGCTGNGTSYRTESATIGDIQQAITATGTVNAVTTVLVGTQVSGTIKSLFVDFNSRVTKGQLIALIDPEMFEAQAAQAKANVEKADATFRDADRTLKRNRELFAKNLIPRSDLDTAGTNFDGAKAQLGQAKAALKVADTNLRYTRIVSPVDGIVISRNVDIGQTVAASFQTPTLFTIAQDLTKMQIDTNVAESDIGVVKIEQDVEFSVDAYPDTIFKGKVWQKRQAPITVQNVVTYDVVIQVDNREMKLMPGMTANVSIIIVTKSNVLKITNAALRFRMTAPTGAAGAGNGSKTGGDGAGEKGPSVWVLENEKPRRVAITPGISDGAYTEIVSGELKEGQNIIIESFKKNKTQSQAGPRMF